MTIRTTTALLAALLSLPANAQSELVVDAAFAGAPVTSTPWLASGLRVEHQLAVVEDLLARADGRHAAFVQRVTVGGSLQLG